MTTKDDAKTAAIMLLVLHPIGGRVATAQEVANALATITATNAFEELGIAFHAAMEHNTLARVQLEAAAFPAGTESAPRPSSH